MNPSHKNIKDLLLEKGLDLKLLDPAIRELPINELLKFTKTILSSDSHLKMSKDKIIRWQDDIILNEIKNQSTILDLGCGEGNLLHRLIKQKQVTGQGIELLEESVFKCIEKGVPVIQGNIDKWLEKIADNSFDYVILEDTLQTLLYPTKILMEMLRVGKRGIISFPNFGYWRVRLDLALRGKMPVTEWLPFHWYDTPNIHLLTLQDFIDWTNNENIRIVNSYTLAEGEIRDLKAGDNLYADEVLITIEKGD